MMVDANSGPSQGVAMQKFAQVSLFASGYTEEGSVNPQNTVFANGGVTQSQKENVKCELRAIMVASAGVANKAEMNSMRSSTDARYPSQSLIMFVSTLGALLWQCARSCNVVLLSICVLWLAGPAYAFLPARTPFPLGRRVMLLAEPNTGVEALQADARPLCWDFFDQLSGGGKYDPEGSKINTVERKLYNITTGEYIYLDPFCYDSIDLNNRITQAATDVVHVLATDPSSKDKGPVVMVRGTGGGKTRALAELQQKLRQNSPDILSLLITFNYNLNTQDFIKYKGTLEAWYKMFNKPTSPVGHIFSLAVITRVTTAFYNIEYHMAFRRVLSAEDLLKEILKQEETIDLLAHYLVYLARKCGTSKVVLLADETAMAEKIMHQWNPDFSASNRLKSSMLGESMSAISPDMQGAVVLSGLKKLPGLTSFGRRIYPVLLSEALSSEEIVNKHFLVDFDQSGRRYTVKLVPKPGSKVREEDCHAMLNRLATVFQALPRGVETVVDELRCRILRDNEVRELVVSAEFVDEVISSAVKKFKFRYAPQSFPPAHHLHALLSGQSVSMDDVDVNLGIMQSVYINTLDVDALNGEAVPKMQLRTSIVPLYAALPPSSQRLTGLQHRMHELFSLTKKWVALGFQTKSSKQVGTLLEQLSLEWIQLKLQAAQDAGHQFISFQQLFQVPAGISNQIVSDSTDDYLKQPIPLGKNSVFEIPVIELQGSFYKKRPGRGKVIGDLEQFRRLNDLDTGLSNHNPIVLLKTAPGDCADLIIVYLSPPDIDGIRSKRCIFLDTTPLQEPAPEEGTGTKELLLAHDPAGHLAACAKEYQAHYPDSASGNGLGDIIARGAYLFVRLSKHDHKDSVSINVMKLGRATTARYFSFMSDYTMM